MRPEPLREEIQTLREKWGPTSPNLYPELADLLFKAGKIAAAMNLLERSLKEDDPASGERLAESGPEEGAWWFRRGLEYAEACLYEEAGACLNRALEAGCENFETHYCLAGVAKSLGQLDEAERHCRKSLEYNSGFAPAFILLGSILKLMGRFLDSANAAKRALLLDPDCAPAHYDLACYYALAGNAEKSLVALEMALAKGFCDFDWIRSDPDLGEVQSRPEFQLLMQSYAVRKG
jgi:tetratricopeptide (TPR) repeat protein